jgi:hypothetical protein
MAVAAAGIGGGHVQVLSNNNGMGYSRLKSRAFVFYFKPVAKHGHRKLDPHGRFKEHERFALYIYFFLCNAWTLLLVDQ